MGFKKNIAIPLEEKIKETHSIRVVKYGTINSAVGYENGKYGSITIRRS